MTLTTLLCFVLRTTFSLTSFRKKNVFKVQLIEKFKFPGHGGFHWSHQKMIYYRKNIFKFTFNFEEIQHWYLIHCFILKNPPNSEEPLLEKLINLSLSTSLISLEKLRFSSLASQLVSAFLLNQPCHRTERALPLASFLLLALPAASHWVCM